MAKCNTCGKVHQFGHSRSFLFARHQPHVQGQTCKKVTVMKKAFGEKNALHQVY